MKYIYQIIVSVCLGCMAISCGKHLVEYGEYYKLNNQSGHTVSIMHNPSPELIPDSLVLKNQQEFNLPFDDYLYYKGDRKIYFDGQYMILYSDLPYEREIILGNFSEYGTGPWTYIYTFTESDYDYAVEHGTDLGEPKPTPEQDNVPTTRTAPND